MVFLFIYTFQAFRRKNVRLGDVFELILVQKREESELVIEESELVILPCLICWFSDSNLSGSLILISEKGLRDHGSLIVEDS